jgi:RNA polymerase sigma-70 factor (ECF subfamily)
MTHEQLSADVKTFRGSIYRLAFGCTGNRFDADDVTQEAFLKLYEYKKDFNDEEHKKAFLIRVTINLCKNLKKSTWHKNRSELDEDMPSSHGYNESERVLREYVMRLKPGYRAVIYLFYYEGYSAAEVGRILKISETAVTTRLDRARGQLKTLLINDEEVIS